MGTNPTRILIVEDAEHVSSMLIDLLDSQGYQVAHASEGRSGLDMARRGLPNLVLLDINIPEINGIEVCKAIKSDPKTAGIKVIMISAMDKGEVMKAAFLAGADEYILKPFDAMKLLRRVGEVLAKT